ncbi:hypothetical protein Tco_0723687 [Tanacetum coccineum]
MLRLSILRSAMIMGFAGQPREDNLVWVQIGYNSFFHSAYTITTNKGKPCSWMKTIATFAIMYPEALRDSRIMSLEHVKENGTFYNENEYRDELAFMYSEKSYSGFEEFRYGSDNSVSLQYPERPRSEGTSDDNKFKVARSIPV